MSLAINARFLCQEITGVQRYALEIVQHLIGRRRLQVTLVAPHSAPEYYANKEVRRTWRIGGSRQVWEQFTLPIWGCRERRLLLNLCNSAPIAWRGQQVTVIHDISPITHPEWYSRVFSRYFSTLVPLIIRRSEAIVTISEFTRAELMANFRIPEERIHIVPCGVRDTFFGPVKDLEVIRQKYDLPDRYVLVLGSINPRKNIRGILDSWELICHEREIRDVWLVFVGGGGSIFASINHQGLRTERVRFLGYCSDNDLPALYQAASLFVFPSLYEGFGLPPLEAMASGLPVVASNKTSIPEVCGDAALLVNPQCPREMAKGLLDVLGSPTEQKRMVSLGRERAAAYQWRRSGELMETVLHRYL